MHITKHAKVRLAQRGASVRDIFIALQTGNKMPNRTDPNNKFTFIDNRTGLYVVTNSEVTVVITVFWKGQYNV